MATVPKGWNPTLRLQFLSLADPSGRLPLQPRLSYLVAWCVLSCPDLLVSRSLPCWGLVPGWTSLLVFGGSSPFGWIPAPALLLDSWLPCPAPGLLVPLLLFLFQPVFGAPLPLTLPSGPPISGQGGVAVGCPRFLFLLKGGCPTLADCLHVVIDFTLPADPFP